MKKGASKKTNFLHSAQFFRRSYCIRSNYYSRTWLKAGWAASLKEGFIRNLPSLSSVSLQLGKQYPCHVSFKKNPTGYNMLINLTRKIFFGYDLIMIELCSKLYRTSVWTNLECESISFRHLVIFFTFGQKNQGADLVFIAFNDHEKQSQSFGALWKTNLFQNKHK